MNILIIGGTRFFGYHTARALRDEGHNVTVFTRGRLKAELPEGIEHMKGDRENDSDLERAAAARSWDVVWDNISYTGEHARAAVRVFGEKCDIFIHTSTLAVYSVCEGIDSPYEEEDFARGRAMVERCGRYPYDYGIARRDGEEVLQQAHAASGFPFVCVRLPAVLGPRDYSLRAWSYWRRIIEDGRLILPDSGIEMQRVVYSGDVVNAIRSIVERGASLSGAAFNIAGAEMVSLRDFVERSAAILSRDVEIVGIPRDVLEVKGLEPEKLSPFTTWGNHLEAIERAKRELDFQPTPMDEWLPSTIAWHVEHRSDSDPPGWGLREREARLSARWRESLERLR